MMLLEAGANQDRATDDGRTPLPLRQKFWWDFLGFPMGLIWMVSHCLICFYASLNFHKVEVDRETKQMIRKFGASIFLKG